MYQSGVPDNKAVSVALGQKAELKKVMKSKEKENVRFEDKTSEEISQDIKKRRRIQMQKLN